MYIFNDDIYMIIIIHLMIIFKNGDFPKLCGTGDTKRYSKMEDFWATTMTFIAMAFSDILTLKMDLTNDLPSDKVA